MAKTRITTTTKRVIRMPFFKNYTDNLGNDADEHENDDDDYVL